MDLRFLHFLGQFFLTGVGDGISRKKRRSFGETVRNVQYFEMLKVKLDVLSDAGSDYRSRLMITFRTSITC